MTGSLKRKPSSSALQDKTLATSLKIVRRSGTRESLAARNALATKELEAHKSGVSDVAIKFCSDPVVYDSVRRLKNIRLTTKNLPD
jgi:hypothetical protein